MRTDIQIDGLWYLHFCIYFSRTCQGAEIRTEIGLVVFYLTIAELVARIPHAIANSSPNLSSITKVSE
jgi:hypothetical protein